MNKEWRTETQNKQPATTSLLEEIREISFVKAELEEYLDTHPYCQTALDYYHKTVDALEILMTRYKNEIGPIRACDVVSNDVWTWVDEPWPWQTGNGGK